MTAGAMQAAALGAFLIPLLGACCGTSGGACPAARAAEKNRPLAAEFIFSNLCDETLVRTVELRAGEIILVLPREKTGADGKAADVVVAYGDEIFLGEGYFTPGEYRLEGKVTAVGKEEEGETLELGFEVIMDIRGPVTVEVSLDKTGEACAVSTEIVVGADGSSRCYEPTPETGPVDCGPANSPAP